MKEKHKTQRQISAPTASQILTCSPIPKMKTTFLKRYSATNNDVINRNMDQFHKKANESHYSKSYCCCHGNLLEFFSIRFGASFNKPNGVFHKLPTWLNELHYLIHDVCSASAHQSHVAQEPTDAHRNRKPGPKTSSPPLRSLGFWEYVSAQAQSDVRLGYTSGNGRSGCVTTAQNLA